MPRERVKSFRKPWKEQVVLTGLRIWRTGDGTDATGDNELAFCRGAAGEPMFPVNAAAARAEGVTPCATHADCEHAVVELAAIYSDEEPALWGRTIDMEELALMLGWEPRRRAAR
jgi:hypothetical protein